LTVSQKNENCANYLLRDSTLRPTSEARIRRGRAAQHSFGTEFAVDFLSMNALTTAAYLPLLALCGCRIRRG